MSNILEFIKTGTEVISPEINNKWETILEEIKKQYSYELLEVPGAIASANEFDLHAIFVHYGFPERYWYPLMRLNDFKSPTDFNGKKITLKIYGATALQGIYTKYIIN